MTMTVRLTVDSFYFFNLKTQYELHSIYDSNNIIIIIQLSYPEFYICKLIDAYPQSSSQETEVSGNLMDSATSKALLIITGFSLVKNFSTTSYIM